jgi:hypothetical protein
LCSFLAQIQERTFQECMNFAQLELTILAVLLRVNPEMQIHLHHRHHHHGMTMPADCLGLN